jgi:DnaJ homolog subfamily C member 19
MLWLVLGGLTLFLFLGGLRAFERASVSSIKALGVWILALGGISLALLLLLSGRGGVALGAAVVFGPLIWRQWQAYRMAGSAGPRPSQQQQRQPPSSRRGNMTPEEAYQVLGLQPGASEADIRAAHHRLMRTAHPDSGGSDWLAARINQARDVLLGGPGGSRRTP